MKSPRLTRAPNPHKKIPLRSKVQERELEIMEVVASKCISSANSARRAIQKIILLFN